MSPRSRGRPPSRGRRQPGHRPAVRRAPPGTGDRPDDRPASASHQAVDCWFDEPVAGDRRSWASPAGHGTYRGIDLELLDPGDDDELTILLEALHEGGNAAGSGQDLAAGDEPGSARLHETMHHIVARQILASDPPQTWQAVQRLAGLGHDWHTIMHMIAGLVAEDVHAVMAEHRRPDPAAYARRLEQLPAGWSASGGPGGSVRA